MASIAPTWTARLPEAIERWSRPDGDARMVALVQTNGIRDAPMQGERSLFEALVRTVCHQLVSVAAGQTIHGRVVEALGGEVTPQAVQRTGFGPLRACGLSNTKTRCILDITERSLDGRLPLDELDGKDDDEVTALLTAVHGFGPWSAKMVLMFDLQRPDVFAPGDLGLRHAAAMLHDADPDDGALVMERMREAWSPHNSLAALALWHALPALREGWRP